MKSQEVNQKMRILLLLFARPDLCPEFLIAAAAAAATTPSLPISALFSLPIAAFMAIISGVNSM